MMSALPQSFGRACRVPLKNRDIQASNLDVDPAKARHAKPAMTIGRDIDIIYITQRLIGSEGNSRLSSVE